MISSFFKPGEFEPGDEMTILLTTSSVGVQAELTNTRAGPANGAHPSSKNRFKVADHPANERLLLNSA